MKTEKTIWTSLEIESLFKMCIAARKEMSFVNPQQATDAEAIGLLVSHHFMFSGVEALRVCSAALEDSNFHSTNDEILEIIEKLEGGPSK